MTPTTGLIIAGVIVALVIADVIRASHSVPFIRPASPEMDEHNPSYVNAERDRRVEAQVRAVNDFRTTHGEAFK